MPLAVLTPVLVAVSFIATNPEFESTAPVHWVMQTISGAMLVFCAISVARGTAVRSMSARHLIVSGLAAAGVLDICHGVLMMAPIQPEALEQLIPWGWLPSRIVLPFMFLTAIWVGVYEHRSQKRVTAFVRLCAIATILFTIACCIVMAFFADALPPIYHPQSTVARPSELIPAALFSLALASYFYTGGWRHDVYEYNLLLSLIIAVIAHTAFMPYAQENFNHLFAAGVTTKMFGYVLLVAAIILHSREGMRVENQSERLRHRAIVETASDAIVTFDADGVIDTFNPAATRMFGHEAEDAIGQNITLLTPEELREPHARYMEHVRSGRAPATNAYSYEAVGLHKDGSTFPVESAINEIQLGKLRLFTSIIRDITQRKAEEERLVELSDRLSLALDVAHLGTWEDNLDTRKLTWNPQMFALYGRDPELGEPDIKEWASITVKEDRPACYAAHEAAVERGDAVEFAYRIKLPDGSIRWFKTTARYIERDNARRLVGVTQDISANILHLQELETARREADDANRAKSAFLATMSHEIRTPLNGVIGLNEVLQQTDLDNYQQELANLINQSANALLDIIEDVLDLSKIEAGRLEIDPTPMSPAQILEDVCSMQNNLAQKSGVDLTFSAESGLPASVSGDGKRLRQILTNLINNAIKFSAKQTRRGSVSVTLAAKAHSGAASGQEPEGNLNSTEFTFTVTDNGVGMDEETLERLFNPFTQADASTSRQFGGTGLGLTISQRLAQLMGGKISVTSQLNKGSTFILTLPFAQREATGSSAKATTGADSETTRSQASVTEDIHNEPYSREDAIADGKLILVAEDNPTNQQVIQHQLAALGYYADVVEDGSLALAAWRNGEYALLLTDLQMPETDGYELARQVRALEDPSKPIPIIAISANTLMDESESCIAVGMNAYLSKPASLEELQSVLSQWLPGTQT